MKLRRYLPLLLLMSLGGECAQLSGSDVDAMLKVPVGGTVEVSGIPVDLNTTATVRLKRIEVFAADARIRHVDNGVERDVPRGTMRSFIADDSETAAPYLGLVISADGGRIEGGSIADNGRLIAIEGNTRNGVMQIGAKDASEREADGQKFAGSCFNDLAASRMQLPSQADVDSAFAEADPADKILLAASRSARVAIDSDIEFMSERFANNTTNATNWLTSLFTQLNAIYERDLDVTLLVGDVFWRTGSDPFPSDGTDINDQLDEFGEVWAANNAALNRAFAAQMSGKLDCTGCFSGIAWVLDNRNYCNAKGQTFGGCTDGTCTFGHYSVNQTQTNTTSATPNDAKFIGHELGHNFGANHTHCSDAVTGDGNPAATTNTIDTCYNGEAGPAPFGCYGGATACPSSQTINGVTGVRGTIMSYCHLLGGCSNSAVFATAHVTYLSPFITLNVNQGCFTTGSGGTISIADRTLGEATSPMNFTLTRSNSSGAASVVATTAAGTATGGGTDYTNVASQTVNFADGSTTATLNVTVNNDNIDELDETFVVNLTSPSAGYTISDAQATGTITDDDTTTITVNDPAAVSEGSPITFVVTLSNPNSRTVTVSRATANGTATSGDFTSLSAATLTFTAGSALTQNVVVNTTDDNLDEPGAAETFALNLSAAANATIGDSSGTGSINDNDPTPTISIADAPIQPENGVNPTRFVVTLSNPSQPSITVTASTADGTATLANSDYQSRSLALTFTTGVSSIDFDVSRIGDTTFEADETLSVNLTNPTAGYSIIDASATGTIGNDDNGPAVSIADASLTEGDVGLANMAFTISIANSVGADVIVNYATAPLDATAITDYIGTGGSATIAAGATTGTLNIPIVGELIDEFDEQFAVTLSATSSSTIGDGQAVGTITDNDSGGDPVYRNGFE